MKKFKVSEVLYETEKIQKDLITLGFSWKTHDDAFLKLLEEIDELKEEIKFNESSNNILEEYGDCLFSLINIGCRLNISSSEALNIAIDKYVKRTNYLLNKAKEENINLSDVPIEVSLEWWKEIKEMEKKL